MKMYKIKQKQKIIIKYYETTLEDHAGKCCNHATNWKTQQVATGQKRPVFIPIPAAMPKIGQTTAQLRPCHTLVK